MRANIGIGLPSNLSPTLTQRALAILRTYGTDAHLWLPGVGVVNGITAGNFIESIGTSAAAVDSPVGYVGDAGKTLGSELVTNGTFQTNTTGWSALTWVSAGVARFNAAAYGATGQSITLAEGKTYELTFTVLTVDSGSVRLSLGGSTAVNGALQSTPGTYTAKLIANATSNEARLQAGGSGFVGNISNISVREIVGAIPATQSTTASKPILRQSGGRYSWQFDGTDDRLQLSAVPFQQVDDHCVIVACRGDSYAALRQVWYNGSAAGSGRSASLFLTPSTGAPAWIWSDDSSTTTVQLSLPVQPLGSTFVTSARRSGTGAIARLNGANQQSGSLASMGATTVNDARIGCLQNGTNLHNGSIGPVIAIKGTVSDADLLTLEKWVGSLSGVTI